VELAFPSLSAVYQPLGDDVLGDDFEQKIFSNRNERARIVENGFAASSGVSKSAKVVLGRVLIKSGLVTGT
jgi:hypothetical protein